MLAKSVLTLLAAGLMAVAQADIKPETIGRAKMAAPASAWLFAKSAFGPAYIFDARTGDMHGLLSVSEWTPTILADVKRGEIYAAESYYTRRHRGERSDMLTVYDLKTLSPTAEIPLPTKVASLGFRQYIGMLDDNRHVVVFNMDPGQSVSVVDVRKRTFVGEISTAGCALVMPTAKRSFQMICGDGTLQHIRLDRGGKEVARTRSEPFFEIEVDPVFDRPVRSGNGWLHVSFEGKVFESTVDDDVITVSEGGDLLTEEDKGWRVGGYQVVEYHRKLGLLFTLMHEGEKDTHEEAGNEVWVFQRDTGRRIARIKLAAAATNLLVSQDDEPLLTVTGTDNALHVYDVKTAKHVRSIEQSGSFPGLLQSFEK